MVKFLHLADVRLGTAFVSRSEALRRRLRAAHRTAFERAIDCALGEEVDALLIAGDFFEGPYLDYDTEQFVREQLHRLDGIPCCYATGDRDPEGRPLQGELADALNAFHCFDAAEPEELILENEHGEPVVRLIGAGHKSLGEDTNLAGQFPPATGELPCVGLVHAYVAEAEQADRYTRDAACTVEDLRKVGYAYWALGHIPVRQHVDDQAHACYAGPLQGARPLESGPQGGLLVTLEEERAPQVDFRPFSPLCWLDIRLQKLSEVETMEVLIEKVQQQVEEAVGRGGHGTREAEPPVEHEYRREAGHTDEQWIVRLTLSGACPIGASLRDPNQQAVLENALTRHLGVAGLEVRTERLTRPVDTDEYRDQPHLLSQVLDLIDQAEADSDLLVELVPELLERSVDPQRNGSTAYAKSLLDGLDREACMRLLTEDDSSE